MTYDDSTIRHNPDSGYPEIRGSDLTGFLKRLRHYFSVGYYTTPEGEKVSVTPLKMRLKYFAVGEYGSQTERPHFHLIIFNLPYYDKYKQRDELIQLLAFAWQLGFVHVGEVTPASIHYVTKYQITKHEESAQIERSRPRAWISKGLGIHYAEDPAKRLWHQETEKVQTKLDGNSFPLPRYLKQKIFGKESLERISETTRINALVRIREEYDRLIAQGENPQAYQDQQLQQKINRLKRVLTKNSML